MLDNQYSVILNILPLFFLIGLMFFIISMFCGSYVDIEGVVSPFRRYWWVILLIGVPLPFLMIGIDVGTLIMWLVIFTIAGGVFFWWMENGFELPSRDPIKDFVKWLRENFRW